MGCELWENVPPPLMRGISMVCCVSKRVARLKGAVRKARNGREVLISLH